MDRSTAAVDELASRDVAPAVEFDAPDEATDAERLSSTWRSPIWPPSPERVLLTIVIVGAALVRFVGAGQVEPNISSIEASHLAAIEAMLVDRGAGLIGLTDAGASDLALTFPTILRLLGREPELAMRFNAALGGIGLAAAFYGLCRARFSVVVSLVAVGMLAFSPWSVYFGRNGELNVFVALWLVAAVWLMDRAARVGGSRTWIVAGAASAIGLYWHPAAIWAPPTLMLVGLIRLFEEPAQRQKLAAGLVLFVVAATVVAGPRMAQLAARGTVVAATLDEHGGGVQTSPTGSTRLRFQQAVRAFLLLDPGVTGEPRYLPAGRAPLDGLTGVLLLGGAALAVWRPRAHVASLVLFVVPLIGSQLTAPLVPDLGRATVALPGLYLLVAGALDRLPIVLPFRSIVSAALLVAVPVFGVTGWQAYAGWMGSAASAQARQPALDYDEVDAWLAEQRDRLTDTQPLLSVAEWRQEHPRLTTGPRAARRSREAAPSANDVTLASLSLEQIQVVQGERDSAAPRGVAATSSGEVFVADDAGRVSRLDAERPSLTPLSASPRLQQISEIVSNPGGQLFLADAERGLLLRLDARGGVGGTFGGDWGMYRPRGVAVGPDGTIYVADTGRNRVVIASAEGRLLKTLGPKTSAGDLEQPTDVAVDASGRIYVALPELGRLMVLDDSGQVLGGWAIPRANTIDSPHLAAVADGAVAITDPSNRRVWLADADGREIASAEIPGRPYGVAAATGRLYVTEPTSGRVLVFSLTRR